MTDAPMRRLREAAGVVAVAVAAIGGIVASACGDASGPREPGSAPPLYRLEPIVRIGTVAEGPPEQLFTFPLGLDVDPVAGEVYVSDRDAREIRVFSREGEFRRRIGGPGDGPAEFDTGPRFAVVGDTLLALDQTALHLFGTDGRHLRTERYETAGPNPAPTSVWGSPSGWWVGTLEFGSTPFEPPHERLYRVDRSGLRLSGPVAEIERSDRPGIYRQLEGLVPAGDAWILTDALDYRLVRHPAGAPPDTLAFDVEPVLPAPSDVDAFAEAQLEECVRTAERAWCDEQLGDFIEERLEVALPPRRPVIGLVRASPEGDLLVERTDLDPEPFDPRSEQLWDLIREGEIVGRVRTPAGFRVRWFGSNELWGVEIDDLDVAYVVGYRILPPGS